MAASEIEFEFTWEDNIFFKMRKRIDGGSWITVVEIEENAHIAAIAGSLKALCMADVNAHLDTIMNEMTS